MPFACAAAAVKAVPSGKTIASEPPAPPSTDPLTEPPGAKTKVSALSAAPWRFSTFVNVTPATVPLSAPVTLQVASLFGPMIVSLPARPSNVTGSGTVLVVWMSIAMTSSRSLPSISMDVTSPRLTASAAPVSDSTSAALPSATRSLWFQPLPPCGDAVALPPSTTHAVAGAVGLTAAAAAGAVCDSAVAVGAAEAAAPAVAAGGADGAGAASAVVAVGAADAAASGDVDVGALASE